MHENIVFLIVYAMEANERVATVKTLLRHGKGVEEALYKIIITNLHPRTHGKESLVIVRLDFDRTTWRANLET